MNSIENKLRESLEEREASNSLRSLPGCSLTVHLPNMIPVQELNSCATQGLADFCSNDYLGFSRSKVLAERIRQSESEMVDVRIGSTGSRLISGNTIFCEKLEDRIAKFHHADAGPDFQFWLRCESWNFLVHTAKERYRPL